MSTTNVDISHMTVDITALLFMLFMMSSCVCVSKRFIKILLNSRVYMYDGKAWL